MGKSKTCTDVGTIWVVSGERERGDGMVQVYGRSMMGLC